MKPVVWFFFLFSVTVGSTQELITTQDAADVTKYTTEIRLIHGSADTNWFLQKRKGDLYVSEYKNDFKLLKNYLLEDILEKNYQILKAAVVENELSMLTANSSKKKLVFTKIDLVSEKVISHQEVSKLSWEGLLQAYFYKENAYVLSVSLDSQELFLRKLEPGSKEQKVRFDLSHHAFKAKGSKDERLRYLFGIEEQGVLKIDHLLPYTLLQTSAKAKSYQRDEKIIVTLDHDSSKTVLLQFDLEQMAMELKELPKPELTKGNSGNSNSLLYKEHIFQLVLDGNEMILEVKNIAPPQKTVYEYRVTDEERITIKNSPMILEGAAYASTRILDETAQFLRKVRKSNPAISITEVNNNYQITLGGSEQLAGNVSEVGGGQILLFDTVAAGLSLHENVRSTYITCLFDTSFTHVEGTITPTVFDKIEVYKTKNNNKPEGLETICVLDEGFVYVTLYNDTFQFIKFN